MLRVPMLDERTVIVNPNPALPRPGEATAAEATAACAEAVRLGLEEAVGTARVLSAVAARDAALALSVTAAATDGDPAAFAAAVARADRLGLVEAVVGAKAVRRQVQEEVRESMAAAAAAGDAASVARWNERAALLGLGAEGEAASAALETRRVAAEASLSCAVRTGGRRQVARAIVRLAAASPTGSCTEWQGGVHAPGVIAAAKNKLAERARQVAATLRKEATDGTTEAAAAAAAALVRLDPDLQDDVRTAEAALASRCAAVSTFFAEAVATARASLPSVASRANTSTTAVCRTTRANANDAANDVAVIMREVVGGVAWESHVVEATKLGLKAAAAAAEFTIRTDAVEAMAKAKAVVARAVWRRDPHTQLPLQEVRGNPTLPPIPGEILEAMFEMYFQPFTFPGEFD
jgi:hypothetical protein